MRLFTINKRISILCEWEDKRNGFRHRATLLINGIEVDSTKVCYTNRTWERHEYDTVKNGLIENTKELTEKERKMVLKKLKEDCY